MATPRNQIESKSVQGEQVGQATRQDGEVLELNIVELERADLTRQAASP